MFHPDSLTHFADLQKSKSGFITHFYSNSGFALFEGKNEDMQISLFDVAGPVMIGPSSSHTAGAARLSRMAMRLVGAPFHRVIFELHGSFAKTYQGHGTDLALVAGVLGIHEDDERIIDAFRLAEQQGVHWEFHQRHFKGAHENTARMRFLLDDGKMREVTGCSLGGGRISIRSIDGFKTDLSLSGPTILAMHHDQKGVIGSVATALAENGINIGVIRSSRRAKGDIACCVIEVDQPVSGLVTAKLRKMPGMLSVQAINPDEEGDDVSELQ